MSIKNPRLKIQILTGIIAVLLVVPLCCDMIQGFVLGFNSALTDAVTYEAYPTAFELTPVESNRVETLRTNVGELDITDFKREAVLFLPEQHTSSTIDVITTVLSVLAVLFTIYYVVAVFRMISTVTRRGVMNREALRRLRKVSFSMLTVYVLFTLSSALPTWYYSTHILPEGYDITYPRFSEGLVVALIFILLTEILHIALQLKEEQDLTI